METQASHRIDRRALLASLAASPVLLASSVRAQEFPPQDVQILRPGDLLYESSQPVYNSRTALRPRIRALCHTPDGLQRMLDHVRDHQVPFAIRGGGHSFEGYSQSDSLVIDTRRLNDIHFDPATRTLDVGAGSTLGDVYRAAAKFGMCFPAGSCPTVGISGHIFGGGFGLLARAFGLACDSMVSAEIIDAQGQRRLVSNEIDPNLFWALKGGGGGTFGLAARLRLQLYPLGTVFTFSQGFYLPLSRAAQFMQAWQSWAPNAPREITSLLKLSSPSPGVIALRLSGQSIGSAAQIEAELARFIGDAGHEPAANMNAGRFIDAIDRFSGGWSYESKFSKGKSDFVLQPLTPAAIDTLMQGLASLPPNNVIVICDAYGGAIRQKRNDETAFAFRDAQFCMQYYSSWQDPAQTPSRLARINQLFMAMRPHVPGFSYVNYCDLDLPDWRRAYWNSNAQRLRTIKSACDPKNLFHHAQSVTPA